MSAKTADGRTAGRVEHGLPCCPVSVATGDPSIASAAHSPCIVCKQLLLLLLLELTARVKEKCGHRALRAALCQCAGKPSCVVIRWTQERQD